MIIQHLIEKISSQSHAEINKKTCLYYRNRFNRCCVCREICTAEAIYLEGDKLKVKKSKCNGCGICKSVCPSQSISVNNFGEVELLKLADKKKKLIIGCSKAKIKCDFKFPCLNGLHKEYLAALLIRKKDTDIVFNLSNCKDCELKTREKNFEKNISNIINFLTELEIYSKVSIVLEEENDISEEKFTRREILALFKNKSMDITEEFVSNIIEQYYDDNKEFNCRDFLVHSIKKAGLSESKTIKSRDIFTNWMVNDNCDGCGFCEGICPYNGWKVEENEEKAIVMFDIEKCRGCFLCFNLCPNKAILEDNFSIYLLRAGYQEKKVIKK